MAQIPVLCFSQAVLKSSVVSNKAVLVPSSNALSASQAAVPSTPKTKQSNGGAALSESYDVVVVNKFAPAGVDINYLPLFGEYLKTENQQLEDQMFISDCDKNFKNRVEASDFFAKMGWEYLAEGNKNLAIHRFNLAWLLDNENPDAFWGLGVVEYQSGSAQKAAKWMKRGIEINDQPNVSLMVDLATVYISCSVEKSSREDLIKAYELLYKAIALQPEYTNAYMQLTVANIVENKIDEAWENFHKGYNLAPEEVSLDVLTELLNRKADPKGVFRKP